MLPALLQEAAAVPDTAEPGEGSSEQSSLFACMRTQGPSHAEHLARVKQYLIQDRSNTF